MTYLQVETLTHRYGEFTAIDGISFDVAAGERLCLLGPSGCGKTTTLQAIAGFIRPQEGSIRIAGDAMIGLPPEARNIGIMFQNYALFPHMTVAENVAFGLRMRRVARAELRARVAEALDVVRLSHKAGRLPAQLSGGEQQRVAFARAIVIRPRLLLLDEPFSNLDARLRLTMRAGLMELLSTLDIATLMVTHDQEEAMAVGDRIAVMKAGRIRQIGTPRALYQTPNSRFVGDFLGESNIFDAGAAQVSGGMARLEVPGVGMVLARVPDGVAPGVRNHLLVRPERIGLQAIDAAVPEGRNSLVAEVEQATFLGPKVELRLRAGELGIQVASADAGLLPAAGGQVRLVWSPEDTVLIGAEDA